MLVLARQHAAHNRGSPAAGWVGPEHRSAASNNQSVDLGDRSAGYSFVLTTLATAHKVELEAAERAERTLEVADIAL